MTSHKAWNPASLLIDYAYLFTPEIGPILDLAGGKGQNGLFLAQKGLSVTLCDFSDDALKHAKISAQRAGTDITIWQVDLEKEGINPLDEDTYGGILVFRYLHRPLMPCIKKALKRKGVLMYETFTIEQAQFGKPRNLHFLLKEGELKDWFREWHIIHYFEGILENPRRALAQIVCRKPVTE